MNIITDILEAAKDDGRSGATRTKLMYKAFLSYEQLKAYLPILIDNEILCYDRKTQTLQITEKGLRFLQIYYEIVNVINRGSTSNSNNINTANDKSSCREKGRKEEDLINIKNIDGGNDNGKRLERLLVVDDNPDILQVLKLGLIRKSNLVVDAFTNPQEALQSFSSNPKAYRLMLSDIRMPQLSGIALARKIKEINSNVKVVLMTAFEVKDNQFSKVHTSARIDGFLQKPFSISDLNNKVLSLL